MHGRVIAGGLYAPQGVVLFGRRTAGGPYAAQGVVVRVLQWALCTPADCHPLWAVTVPLTGCRVLQGVPAHCMELAVQCRGLPCRDVVKVDHNFSLHSIACRSVSPVDDVQLGVT
jgi:hypothetical protein